MKIIIPDFVLPALKSETCELVKSCDFVTVDQQGTFSKDIQGTEVVMLPWKLPESAMQLLLTLDSVRWIHSVSAGIDHAMSDDLRTHRAVLTNARRVFDIPIAETVLAYILMVVKRMPEFFAYQQKHHWHRLDLKEAGDQTVGLVGLGSIGTEIARRCQALGMRVIATRRRPERGADFVARLYAPEEMDTLLALSDFVVVAVPLTPETRCMLSAPQFQVMKPTAWLVNIARGPVVDENALIQALQQGEIGGAALDVFEQEPLPPESPLWDMPNVIITPHNTWSTPHLLSREAELFLENLKRYLRADPLLNVVDKSLEY
ncbi:MAG: D-2-hydroxyacid dehydrogenase [Anaerolineae bacterium]|nr:D-2-hydroxyacid dehydrogenase [Anaerolineae bacterium]